LAKTGEAGETNRCQEEKEKAPKSKWVDAYENHI
jgi:hypothetical protein